MPYRVVVTDDARRDIEAIGNHIAEHDSIARAERIADLLLEVAASLEENPKRGSRPRELVALGRVQFLQLIRRPWRVIYTVEDSLVIVHLVADGRRDMQSLLAERLLGP